MKTSLRSAVLPIALVLSAGALANNDTPTASASATNSDAVATLKSALPSTAGFEVDNVRTTNSGVACITYRVSNDKGGETKAHAVVQGDKVLRSSSRSKDFENAWNSQCVAAK